MEGWGDANLLECLEHLPIVPRLYLDGLCCREHGFQHLLTLLPLGISLREGGEGRQMNTS